MKATVHACLYAILSSFTLSTDCLAAHNPPTNYVCTYVAQTVDIHSNAPAIGAVVLAGGPYALPAGGNLQITVSGCASVITNGQHVKVTTFLPCPLCGSTKEPYSSPYAVTPEIYASDWTFSPAGAGTGGQSFSGTNSVSAPGVYTLTANFKGTRSCGLCECKTGASTNCTVYQLTLTDTLWLGLDRTDAGTKVYGTGTATLNPSDSATYTWELTAEGGAPVVCILTNMADNTAEYRTTDKEKCSAAYFDQKLKGTATVSDVYPEFSLSASTNFTVVKVDVILGGLVETNEEVVGGFVQYHYDFPEYTNWHSGLTVNSGFQFIKANVIVTPSILPSGDDQVVISYEGEDCFTNAVFVLQGDDYVPAKTIYTISELPDFYIHAHEKSGERMFRAVHTRSGATDLAKVTNVDVDIDIDSDHSSAFGGPGQTAFEDWIEDGIHADETNKPLKYVVFNDYYRKSMSGLPGYADVAMNTPTGPVEKNLLIPVKFTYPTTFPGLDTNSINIKFEYAGWNPAEITSNRMENGLWEWPKSGSMRLWMKKEGRNPKKVTDDPAGDYIPAREEIPVAKLKGQTEFFLEGTSPSDTIGQDQIKAIVKISYGKSSVTMEDDLKCTVFRVALDVDTFNDSGISPDPHQPGGGEDHYEDMTNSVGKVISINNRDKDNDGIPDYLDGFDLDPEIEADNVNADEIFVPLVLTLPKDIDYSNTTIRVTYAGDDPKLAVNPTAEGSDGSSGDGGTGTSEEGEGGRIRIWMKPGSAERNKADVSGSAESSGDEASGGDYLAPGKYDATVLGFTGRVNSVTFYVEGVKLSSTVGDIRVLFEVKLDERYTGDEYLAADAVRFTCVDSLMEITDYFTPRQAESPPYHVCKADFRFAQYMAAMCDTMELQIKRSQDTWGTLFYKAGWNPNASEPDTKLYEVASGGASHVYNVTGLYGGVNTQRICWDGRKDADGDGTIDKGSDGFNIWAERPENTGQSPKLFDARIVLLKDGKQVHIGPTATTRTCPLPLDTDGLPMAGPAPYFGFFRDQINSKYQSVMLDSPAIVTKSDGRPCVSFIPYFNGNMWNHTPMKFGWTHNYEIRMLPVYVNGVRKLYFQGEGDHLFGPADAEGKLWIFGEQATVKEEGVTSGEPGSIKLTTRAGTKYTFNGFGQPLSVEDRNENKVTVTLSEYSNPNLLIKYVSEVSGPGGSLTFGYSDDNTQLDSVSLGGRNLTFGYCQATEKVYGQAYAADEVLKTISGLEYVHEFTMDQGRRANRASRVITGSMTKRKVGDFEHNFEYDQPENLETPVAEAKVKEYDVAGEWRKTTITADSATYANGQSAAHSYAGNKLQSVTVSGNGGSATYRYDYNALGQRTKASTAAGETSMAYDGKGNLTDITPPDRAAVKLTYDETFGQVTKRTLTGTGGTREFVYTLDAKGNVTRATEQGGAGLNNRSWVIAPNNDGTVNTVTDPSGTVSTYAYGNDLGLVQSITRSGVKLLDRSYDAFGNMTSDKDAKGIGTAQIVYDTLDRALKVKHTAGPEESYEYNALGQLRKHVAPPAGRSSAGLTTVHAFSGAEGGKPTGRTETGTGVSRTCQYTDVDDEGLVKTMTVTEEGESVTSTFAYDYAGRAVSESWASVANKRWELLYDLAGNTLTSKDGEGNATSMTYYSDNSLHVLTRPGSFGSVTRTIDGFGNATSVVDNPGTSPMGNTPTATTGYEYDAFNRVTKMTDPANKSWEYTYDALDNLLTVKTPKLDTHTYNYDAKSHLEKYILPGNKTFVVTSDDNGSIETFTVPKGGLYKTPSDSFGNRLALESPAGVGKYGSSVNNPYGRSLESLRGGFKTTLDCDDDNRVITEAPPHAKGANKRTVSYGLYGPRTLTLMDNKTVTRDLVTANPLARKVTAGGRVVETLSDGNGNNVSTTLKATAAGDTDKTTATEYDAFGRPTRVTEGAGQVSRTWDGRGNLLSLHAPGRAMYMSYNAADRLTSKTVDGRQTTYGYDDNGNCVKIDPPGPVEVTFEYDERGQIKERIIKINGAVYRTETITRDNNGAITARTVKNAGGMAVCSESFGRDANDRLASFGTRTATDSAFLSYSPDSQMTAEAWAGTWTAPVGADGLVSSVSASPAFTFDRDNEGRVTTVTRNGATAYTYTYDNAGLLATETDGTSTLGGNAVITHQNDAYGHSMVRGLPAGASLTETLTDDGRVGSSAFTFHEQTKSVSFTYEPSSRLLSAMDLPGQAPTVGFSYNNQSEITCITAGTNFWVGLSRDGDTGRVLTKYNSNLNVTDTYAYHGMGRLTAETRSGGSYSATYEYDAAGKRTSAQVTGDFTHFTPPAASPEGTVYPVGQDKPYTNIADALTQVIMDRGNAEFTSPAIIQLEPGTHAAPATFEAPALRTTVANRLIIQGRPGTTAVLSGDCAVLSPSNVLWRGLAISGTLTHSNVAASAVSSCLVTGALAFADCSGAFVVGNTFKAPSAAAPLIFTNCTGALVRNNIFLVASPDGAAIAETGGTPADRDYDLFWPSNAQTPTEAHGLSLDPLLDSVTFEITADASPAFRSGKPVAGFDKDVNGSLRHPLTPCRGASERMVAGEGDIRDGGGRLVRRVVQNRVQNLGYDGRNRLTSWNWDGSAGTSCSYDYDHAGRRILTRETIGGVTKVTRYVYDGADVCAEYEDSNNDGTVDRTRVYWLLPGMDRRIGFAETVGDTTTFYYYLTDHVGTVLRIVTESGTVVNQYDYDAFGRVRSSSETVENRYLFQGREWDRNGGFYYFRNRIYLPERGEFASPDMNLGRGILGELDGMATLTFCGGDPVNMMDPTGLAHKESAPGLWDNSVDWGKWVADDWWELPLVGIASVLDSSLYCYENLAAAPVMAGLGWVGEKDEEYGVTEQYMNLSASIPGFALSGGGAYALQRSLSFARTTVASAKEAALLRKIATTANKTLTSSPKPVASRIGPGVKSSSSLASTGGSSPLDLIPISSSKLASFESASFADVQPGMYYQSQRLGQKSLGEFFGDIRPVDSLDAEILYNIRAWGNNAEQLAVVEISPGLKTWVGPVKNATGRQIFVPKNLHQEFVRQVETTKLFVSEKKWLNRLEKK